MEDIVIIGRHAIRGAIVSGHTIDKIWIREGIKKQQINDILKNAKTQKLIIQTIPKSRLDNLANAPRQGVAALIASYECADLDQFIQSQKEKEGPSTIIILDGLEDPRNLGSIIRTVDASRVDGAVILKRRFVALTQIVAKASIDAIQHIPAMRVTNLSEITDELKDNRYRIVGTETDNAIGYRSIAADIPPVIVIGSGRQSMNRLVRDRCNFHIKVPTVGHVNNLSAPVAASLMMYEIYRRRHQIGNAQ